MMSSTRIYKLIAFLSLWCQLISAYRLTDIGGNVEQLNPNLRCPGKNEEQKWLPCKNGGYIVNDDPKNCADRYICYVGLNEPCHRFDKCADNAICTVCGICQKCDNPKNCSGFELCPNLYGFSELNFIKRLMPDHNGMEDKEASTKIFKNDD